MNKNRLFDEWCVEVGNEEVKNNFNISQLTKSSPMTEEVLLSKLNHRLVSQKHNVYIGRFNNGVDFRYKPTKEVLTASNVLVGRMDVVGIENFAWKQIAVKEIFISSGCRNLIIHDCDIGSITLSGKMKCQLKLIDCRVGSITLNPECLKNLIIRKCVILNINCPASDGGNPFTGDVRITDTFFPRNANKYRMFQGPQSYRNLRSHLETLNNQTLSDYTRALELETECVDERGLNRCVNYIYKYTSRYGLRPGFPLLLTLVLYSLAFAYFFNMDPGTVNDSASNGTEWYISLKGNDEISELKRALLMPLQSIFNPLAAFSTKRIFMPQTGLGQSILTTVGICIDLLLAISLMAIRKRFKLRI